MRITLKEIQEKRFDKNRSRQRKWSERYIPLNAIGKLLSPYPTYVFLNLGIHPDWITFVSLGWVVISAALFVAGYGTWAVVALLCFILFDSVDGDMARCIGPTKYGGVLDSFGADFFYAFITPAIGFYLLRTNAVIGSLPSEYLALIGGLVALTFLLYRMVQVKLDSYLEYIRIHSEAGALGGIPVAAPQRPTGFIFSIAKLYRHQLIRGNFFAEAGMAFWFSVLILARAYYVLGIYLIILFIYNVGYLIMNIAVSYTYFLNTERQFSVTNKPISTRGACPAMPRHGRRGSASGGN